MLSPQSNFKSSRDTTSRKKKLAISLVILVILIILVSSTPLKRLVAGGLEYAGKPFWSLRNSIMAKMPRVQDYFKTRNRLINENDELRGKVGERNVLLAENLSLKVELEDLKNMFGRKPANSERMASVVLSRPSDSYFDSIIIDVGRKDGVSIGNKVYSSGITAIGVIQEIYLSTSKVLLFSSNNVRTNVLVGDERIALLATGEGGQNFSVEFPADVDITQNDLIILSDSLGSVIGQIETVRKTPGGLISKALGRSTTNINQLMYVEVDLDK